MGSSAIWLASAVLLVAFAPVWSLIIWIAAKPGPIEAPTGTARGRAIVLWWAAVIVAGLGLVLVSRGVVGPSRPDVKDFAPKAALAQTLLLGALIFAALLRRRSKPAEPSPGAQGATRQVSAVLVFWAVVGLALVATALGPLENKPGVDHVWKAVGLVALVVGSLLVALVFAIRRTRSEGLRISSER